MVRRCEQFLTAGGCGRSILECIGALRSRNRSIFHVALTSARTLLLPSLASSLYHAAACAATVAAMNRLYRLALQGQPEQMVRVRVPDTVRADTLHQGTILTPKEGKGNHPMVGWFMNCTWWLASSDRMMFDHVTRHGGVFEPSCFLRLKPRIIKVEC